MSNQSISDLSGKRRHVGAEQTLAFVRTVAQPGATILEAGCGNGILASHLSEAGFHVTAIDNSKKAVEASRAIGVAAEYVDFLEYENDNAFDIVLFSRALHHMHPIDAVVEKAASFLTRKGRLLLEDVGAELIDVASAAWFYGLKSVMQASKEASALRGPALEDGNIPVDPLGSWKQHHFVKHNLAESSAMRTAVKKKFQILDEHAVPYLYRYLVDNLPIEQGEEILNWETLLCKLGIVTLIGVRLVAKKLN